MLKEFLERLGKFTGKTYTASEFKQIIEEALDTKEVKEDKKSSDEKKKSLTEKIFGK